MFVLEPNKQPVVSSVAQSTRSNFAPSSLRDVQCLPPPSLHKVPGPPSCRTAELCVCVGGAQA
eukprot:2228152-Rhodomonas_salina.3